MREGLLLLGDDREHGQRHAVERPETGLKDLPIAFSQIRKGIDFGRILKPVGTGKNRRLPSPSVDFLKQHGIVASLHDQYDGHVVTIFPRGDQVNDLRTFFQRHKLKLSMTGIEADTFTMFGRYEYTSGAFQDTVRCNCVIVRLSPAHRSVAVQLGMRFGRMD